MDGCVNTDIVAGVWKRDFGTLEALDSVTISWNDADLPRCMNENNTKKRTMKYKGNLDAAIF